MSATRISGLLEHEAVEHGNLSVKPDLTDKDPNQQQWTKVDHGRGKNRGSIEHPREEEVEDDKRKGGEEETGRVQANAYDTLSARKLNKLYNQIIPEGSANAKIYGRKFEREKAGKRINNIAGYMGVSIKLDKGTFLIRDVPDVGVVITTVPHSSEFHELGSFYVVGEKKIGDLMKVIKEAQQFNFFDLKLGYGDTGNCISTVAAAKYFLEARDQGVSIPYVINEEQCKQAHYEVLVDQLHRYPELQEFMRSNEQAIQALMEELRSNPQFKELNLLVKPQNQQQQQQQQQNQQQNQRQVPHINIAYSQYKGIDRLAQSYTSTLQPQPQPQRQREQQQEEKIVGKS